jgi:MATE family multidrug resistance protein
MRNMMLLSLLAFFAAWSALAPVWGNHGLWASLLIFFAARAVTLLACYPRLERHSFG